MIELDPALKDPPDEAVFCLLCRGTVLLPDGSLEKYDRHLTQEHGIFYNRQWLVERTLFFEKPKLAKEKGFVLDEQENVISTVDVAVETEGNWNGTADSVVRSSTSEVGVKTGQFDDEAVSIEEFLDGNGSASDASSIKAAVKSNGKTVPEVPIQFSPLPDNDDYMQYDVQLSDEETVTGDKFKDISEVKLIFATDKDSEVKPIFATDKNSISKKRDISPEVLPPSKKLRRPELTSVVKHEVTSPVLKSPKSPHSSKNSSETSSPKFSNKISLPKIKSTRRLSQVISTEENSTHVTELSKTKQWVKSARRRCDVRLKKTKCPDLLRDLEEESKEKKKDGPQKLFSDDFAEECKTCCELCLAVFKVSFLKFHVESQHGKSMRSYLADHGEPRLEMAGTLEGAEGETVTVIKRVVTVHHRCKLCGQEMLMIKSVVGDHVKSQHKISLRTYIEDHLNKDKGNQRKKDPKEKRRIKYNVDSSDEDNNLEDKVESTKKETAEKKNETLLLRKSSDLPKKGTRKKEPKIFSDDYRNSSIILCEICSDEMSINRLRSHVLKKHNMDVRTYKKKHGMEYKFVRRVLHQCKVCGTELIMCADSVAAHVRTSHNMSSKEYNTKYKLIIKKKSDNDMDEHSPSTSSRGDLTNKPKKLDTSMSSSSSMKSVDSVAEKKEKPSIESSVVETPDREKVMSPSKEKLVENDNKWYNGNTFSCKKCIFKSSSLDNFRVHVKSDHGTTLQKFSKDYSRTNNKYKCQICSKEVEHEKSAIQDHVVGHCLNLDVYEKLYERNKKKEEIKEKPKEKKDVKCAAKVDTKPTIIKANTKKTALKENAEPIITKENIKDSETIENNDSKCSKANVEEEEASVNTNEEALQGDSKQASTNVNPEHEPPIVNADHQTTQVDTDHEATKVVAEQEYPKANVETEAPKVAIKDVQKVKAELEGAPNVNIEQVPKVGLEEGSPKVDNGQEVPSVGMGQEELGNKEEESPEESSKIAEKAEIIVDTEKGGSIDNKGQEVVTKESLKADTPIESASHLNKSQILEEEELRKAVKSNICAEDTKDKDIEDEEKSDKFNITPGTSKPEMGIVMKRDNSKGQSPTLPTNEVTPATLTNEKSTCEIKEATPAKLTNERRISVTAGGQDSAASTTSENEEVFVYLCPFPNCSFQTDFQGMKTGPAAKHGITAHATQPWEIKKHGLKWKKVPMTLERRMSNMFGEL